MSQFLRLFLGSIGLTLGLAFSGAEAAEQVDTLYGFGTVKKAFGDKLVVQEYDIETQSNVEVTYTLSSNAIIDGVGSLGEIQVGDAVDVVSTTRAGENLAQLILVEADR